MYSQGFQAKETDVGETLLERQHFQLSSQHILYSTLKLNIFFNIAVFVAILTLSYYRGSFVFRPLTVIHIFIKVF